MLRDRRLPGFRFEVLPPPQADPLPRMDVACFVGFAASGPLHRPVQVASIAQFEMIFGEDAKLAWDDARGEQIYAYLAPAVRAFFRNGGRRAWIIRVAGDAQFNHFPLSSLLQVQFDKLGKVKEIQPAYATARAPGSWSDGIVVSTSLMSRTLVLTPISYDPPQFRATLASSTDLIVGDLLRVTFENGTLLMCAVKSIEEVSPGSLTQLNQYRVACDKATWFRSSWQQTPVSPWGEAYSYVYAEQRTAIPVSVPFEIGSPPVFDWPTREQPTSIKLDLTQTNAPTVGSLMLVQFGTDQLWFRVENTGAGDTDGSPLSDRVRVGGQGLWWTTSPASLTDSIDISERLSFELWARSAEDKLLRISDLTFDSRHSLCWDVLPSDLQLYPDSSALPQTHHANLWSIAADPRFPLAGEERSNVLYVPMIMSALPDTYLGPDLLASDRLTRDGLETFHKGIFLDRDLDSVCVRDLINEADNLRYYAPQPRSLTGIHAVLGLDEVSLISVPDAIQRGWSRKQSPPPPNPMPSGPLVRPEWWHFLDCTSKPVIKAVDKPEPGHFLDCDIHVIPPPHLHIASTEDSPTFTIYWETLEPGLIFILEEATRPDFRDVVTIYTGPNEQITLYGHTPGVFYYRVRGFIGDQSSDWSNGELVNVAMFQHWTLDPVDDFDPISLLGVQQSLLRLCAARGNLFAVLALPEHYRTDDLIVHIQTLTNTSSGFCGKEEPRTLSFGAIYHPWLIGHEESQPTDLRRTPPDGAMTGMIARRSIAEGAWVAPANELLRGVVALTPLIDRNCWQQIQNAQLNLIRQEPRGFLTMSNDTLTSDQDLLPINVRRLLILLRRLALRLGERYVFEPNDAAFRRSVQRGFESMLEDLFKRGAFAGATADSSFQVVADTSVNTPQMVDQGRFVVELRVAPSLPLRFLTIRLVQTGDQTLVTQEA